MSKEKKRNRSRKRAGYARGDSYAKRRGRKLKNLQNATEKKEQAHRDVDRFASDERGSGAGNCITRCDWSI